MLLWLFSPSASWPHMLPENLIPHFMNELFSKSLFACWLFEIFKIFFNRNNAVNDEDISRPGQVITTHLRQCHWVKVRASEFLPMYTKSPSSKVYLLRDVWLSLTFGMTQTLPDIRIWIQPHFPSLSPLKPPHFLLSAILRPDLFILSRKNLQNCEDRRIQFSRRKLFFIFLLAQDLLLAVRIA